MDGNIQAAEALLRSGAQVDIRDQEGKTPLMYASHHNIAELLIQYGEDPNAEDLFGSTPLSRACDKGYTETAKTRTQT